MLFTYIFSYFLSPFPQAFGEEKPEHPFIEQKDVKSETCLTCHPEKKEGKFVHSAVTMGCENCHQANSENGKTTIALVATGKELCKMCHEDKVPDPQKVALHSPVADNCTTCHSPHSSDNKAQVLLPTVGKTESENLCLMCHSDIGEQLQKKKFVHNALQAGCTTCHDPHFKARAKLLRADANSLCLECHRQGMKLPDDLNQPLKLFEGKVELTASFLEGTHLVSGSDTDHPMARHPQAKIEDPRQKGKPITCLSCHRPHAGDGSLKLLVTERKSASSLCVECHK